MDEGTVLRQQLDELVEQREETLSLMGEETDPDGDVVALLSDIEAEVKRMTIAIAAHSGYPLPAIMANCPTEYDSKAPIVQVHWDNGRWYSCQVKAISFDHNKKAIMITVLILGYKLVEDVPLDKLRRWQPHETQLASGVTCHAVHPEKEVFSPARIDRVTLKNTVWVTFVNSSRTRETAEVPLSFIHLGKYYPQLRRKLENMSEEDRRRVMNEERRRKRERTEERKKMRIDALEQSTQDWKVFIQNLGQAIASTTDVAS